MVHSFKDHSRDHKIARDNIKTNIDLIFKQNDDICNNISLLREMLIVASWYLAEQMIEIDTHYEDAPLEHLTGIANMCSEYYRELLIMDTNVKQLIFIINQYFDFNTEEMICTSERVAGDL